MFENQPDLVRKLHQSGELPAYLDQKLQPALRRVMQLVADRGMGEDEAFQTAADEMLCPPNGPAFSDNPPEPVPLAEQRRIIHNL
jgi:hypothetical protein